MVKLSILIPTVKEDEDLLMELLEELSIQIEPYGSSIQILIDYDEYESIGRKRNKLMEKATGDYVACFDSDDKPSIYYIDWMMKVVESGCDCGSFLGLYSENGVALGKFEHSLKYKKWETTQGEIKYLRFPNHLNAVKTEIAKQFKFSEKNHGEDFDWSTLLHESGLLKTEFNIPEIIYYYNKVTK